jgi:hypothetical protein
MPSLIAIAGWEEAILASLNGTTGTIEERDEQVRRSGLYAEYPAILRSYLDHLSRESRPEALKRAVFLVWLSTIELPPYSGLAELPERYAREAMLALEVDARGKQLDDEFLAMLAWYQSILSLPFELFGANRDMPAATRDVAPDAWRQFDAAQFRNRGQLGHYWRSVLGSSAL